HQYRRDHAADSTALRQPLPLTIHPSGAYLRQIVISHHPRERAYESANDEAQDPQHQDKNSSMRLRIAALDQGAIPIFIFFVMTVRRGRVARCPCAPCLALLPRRHFAEGGFGWRRRCDGRREHVAARWTLDGLAEQLVRHAELALTFRAVDDFRHSAPAARRLNAGTSSRQRTRRSPGPRANSARCR